MAGEGRTGMVNGTVEAVQRLGPHPQLLELARRVMEQNAKILEMNARLLEVATSPLFLVVGDQEQPGPRIDPDKEEAAARAAERWGLS